MKLARFFLEQKHELIQSDFSNLRLLYLPVIGRNGIALFEHFSDIIALDNGLRAAHDTKEITSHLKASLLDIARWCKKLEAVGLIRTFENSDNKTFIFRLNKPLDAHMFMKNSLLHKDLIFKIGEIRFERILMSSKKVELEKDEYQEITTKYQDLFSINDKALDVSTNTMEIAVPTSLSIDRAVETLISTQFIFFLTQKKASPSQVSIINKLRNIGLSSASINVIIKYSWDVNGKVVMNFIEKIATDLIKKDIRDFKSIKVDLSQALKTRSVTSSIKTAPHENNQNRVDESAVEWEELFNNLGGSF